MYYRYHTKQMCRTITGKQRDHVRINQYRGNHHRKIRVTVQLSGCRERHQYRQEIKRSVSKFIHQNIGVTCRLHHIQKCRTENDEQYLHKTACNNRCEQRCHTPCNKVQRRNNRINFFYMLCCIASDRCIRNTGCSYYFLVDISNGVSDDHLILSPRNIDSHNTRNLFYLFFVWNTFVLQNKS